MRQWILIGLALSLWGCNPGDSPLATAAGPTTGEHPRSDPVQEPDNPPPLQAALLLKDKFGQEAQQFSAGEEITLELRIDNTTDRDLSYDVTLPGHDIQVLQGQTSLWSKYFGMAFIQVITEVTIPAGTHQTISSTWNGTDNNGQLLPPGQYQVVPTLYFFFNKELIPAPAPLAIVLH